MAPWIVAPMASFGHAPLIAELDALAQTDEQDAHCIVTPLHYERNYAYPLVVWLHGPGGDERQVTRVMPLVSSRNYAAVGPRGTIADSSNPDQVFALSGDALPVSPPKKKCKKHKKHKRSAESAKKKCKKKKKK